MKEAFLYEKLSNNKVQCRLCNHFCVIDEGERGLCGVRENNQGPFSVWFMEKLLPGTATPSKKNPCFTFFREAALTPLLQWDAISDVFSAKTPTSARCPWTRAESWEKIQHPKILCSQPSTRGQRPFPTPTPNRPSIWKRHWKRHGLQQRRGYGTSLSPMVI